MSSTSGTMASMEAWAVADEITGIWAGRKSGPGCSRWIGRSSPPLAKIETPCSNCAAVTEMFWPNETEVCV